MCKCVRGEGVETEFMDYATLYLQKPILQIVPEGT